MPISLVRRDAVRQRANRTFEQLRGGANSLSSVYAFVPLGFNNQSITVNLGGQPGVTGGEMVTGGYFPGLGVAAFVGHAITEGDLKPGAPTVAVLSYGYWSFSPSSPLLWNSHKSGTTLVGKQ